MKIKSFKLYNMNIKMKNTMKKLKQIKIKNNTSFNNQNNNNILEVNQQKKNNKKHSQNMVINSLFKLF